MFLYENLDSRAPNGFPDRNIGKQRRRIFALPGVKNRRLFEGGTTEFLRFSLEGQKFPPTFPVPIWEAVGGGMVPFSFFVVPYRAWPLYETCRGQNLFPLLRFMIRCVRLDMWGITGLKEKKEIEQSNYELYMGLALSSAQRAFDQGEFPVGAVIVYGGRVVAEGYRVGTTSLMNRPSEIDHAEMRALRQLEFMDEEFDPGKAVIFSTMEPCLMCFSAIILSGIKKIVYAYEDPMGGGTCCNLDRLKPLYRDSGVEIISGVLRKKSLDLFGKFFQKENNLYWKNSVLERYTLIQVEGTAK